jgi:hypothetical protein
MFAPRHLLVVADQTLESCELISAIGQRAQGERLRVTLLVPSPIHQRAEARARLDGVIDRLILAGIDAIGVVGDSIACVDVSRLWDPAVYDEVIVVTPSAPLSRWLRVGLPQRIAKLTGSQVRHVVASGAEACRRQAPEPRSDPSAHCPMGATSPYP